MKREYNFIIDTVIVSNRPDISGNTISYGIDIIFVKIAPRSYWIFYNAADSSLVIDIYGGYVKPFNFNLPSDAPVKEIEVKNMSTKMTLSGKQSHIKIRLDQNWNFEAQSADPNIININIWKPSKIIEKEITLKKRQFYFVYISAVVTAAWAVIGIFLAIHKKV